jgi:protein SCO1
MRRRFLAMASVTTITVTAGWASDLWAAGLYDGPAPWLDDQSHSYSLLALRGTPTVMTLAYGACRRVCSGSLRVMEQLQALADQRGVALNFVVVGLNPAEDRPADWAQLRVERHLGRPNWQFLSGPDAAIRRLAGRLGVRYWHYGEHVMHDFRVVLLSADGVIVRTMDAVDQPLERLLP